MCGVKGLRQTFGARNKRRLWRRNQSVRGRRRAAAGKEGWPYIDAILPGRHKLKYRNTKSITNEVQGIDRLEVASRLLRAGNK
jgi:hypothetical protein